MRDSGEYAAPEDEEISPNDPDYDLSEAAGYAGYEPPKGMFPLPQWLVATVSILLILAIVVPLLLQFT